MQFAVTGFRLMRFAWLGNDPLAGNSTQKEIASTERPAEESA